MSRGKQQEQLFDDDLIKDCYDYGDLDDESPWSLQEGILRPKTSTLLAYSKIVLEGNHATQQMLRFIIPSMGTRSTNLLIPVRNLLFFKEQSRKLLSLPRGTTHNEDILEVYFPFKVEHYDVMRKFFHCQNLNISQLPEGIEFFAQELGLTQIYLASFVGRIRYYFGDRSKRMICLGGVIKKFISYCGVLKLRIPTCFLEYFTRTFAMEFDDQRSHVEEAMSHGGHRFLLFMMQNGMLYSLIEVVSLLGSQELAVYMLERVVQYRCLFQDEQMRDVLASFDWRDRQLHQFVLKLRDVDIRFWRNLALTKTNFALPTFAAHIFRVELPRGLLSLLNTTDVTPSFSFQRPLIHGAINSRRIPYVGYRLHRVGLFSVYLLKADQLRILVLFVRHDLVSLQGWANTSDTRPWPEVTFAKLNCSCLLDSSWTGSVPMLGKEDLLSPLFNEIRSREGCTGDGYLLMSERLLESWKDIHTPQCSLHMRVRFVSDLQLVQRKNFRLILRDLYGEV